MLTPIPHYRLKASHQLPLLCSIYERQQRNQRSISHTPCKAYAQTPKHPKPPPQLPCPQISDLGGTELFRKHSKCPFAPKATFFPHNITWQTEKTFQHNMTAYQQALQLYIEHIRHHSQKKTKCHDFFSIEAPAQVFGRNHQDFQQWIHDVLMVIQPEAIRSLQQVAANDRGDYTDTNWRFLIEDIRFFVLTSSPHYPEESSRYSGGDQQQFVLLHLQPELSFNYWLPKDSDKRRHIKENIRARFANHHRPYEHLHVTLHQEPLHHAMKFVFPLPNQSQQVPWWKRILPSSND